MINREKVEVAPIVEKMVDYFLRWVCDVLRRYGEELVRRVDQMGNSPLVSGRVRPRETIGQII